MANLQRILIIKPSALGDVATTLPLLCDLRAAYPDAKIDWLVQREFAPLIEGHDALHEIIPFDRKKLASWWWKPSAFKLFMRLLKTLRANHYDLVLDAQGLFRSGFFARITGAQKRIGFAHARELAPIFYTHKVRMPAAGLKMLAVDRMRALAQPLGIPMNNPAQFRLPVKESALVTVSKSLLHSSFHIPLPWIAVIPGARWATKRWPIDRYTELVHHLLAAGRNVALLGSPDEKPLCDQIQAAIEKRKSKDDPHRIHLLNLGGKTQLSTLVAFLSKASLVIANDSGPLHVATALGKPVIALYGPTSPDYVGPYQQLENVLRHEVPCHPCRRRECDHHSCMNGLSVELVWERTRATLKG